MDMTIIINFVLGTAVPFILLVVAGYLILTYRNETVMQYVRIAVKAAEQIYSASGQGKEKFEYVANWISEKFKIPKDKLKVLIESAVYELNSDKSENKLNDVEKKE